MKSTGELDQLVWTIHHIDGQVGQVIGKDCQFRLESHKDADTGELLYYRIRAISNGSPGQGGMHDKLKGTVMYPLGFDQLDEKQVSPWDEKNSCVKDEWGLQAGNIHVASLKDGFAIRLEGQVPDFVIKDHEILIIRMFVFPNGVKNGNTFMVFDLFSHKRTAQGENELEDGTAHGEGK